MTEEEFNALAEEELTDEDLSEEMTEDTEDMSEPMGDTEEPAEQTEEQDEETEEYSEHQEEQPPMPQRRAQTALPTSPNGLRKLFTVRKARHRLKKR